MIFDALCGMAERLVPELSKMCSEAELFEFPQPAREAVPEAFKPDVFPALTQIFYLPFKVTAVEDPGCCVLFADSRPGQIGFDQLRSFLSIAPMLPDAFMDVIDKKGEHVQIYGRDMPEGSHLVTVGSITGPRLGEAPPPGRVFYWFVATKNTLVIPVRRIQEKDPYAAGALKIVGTTLDDLIAYNQPGRLVVERKPDNARTGSERLLRSGDRSRYCTFTAAEILAQLAPPGLAESEARERSLPPAARPLGLNPALGCPRALTPAVWAHSAVVAQRNGCTYTVRTDL
jgi:hypothetical protein